MLSLWLYYFGRKNKFYYFSRCNKIFVQTLLDYCRFVESLLLLFLSIEGGSVILCAGSIRTNFVFLIMILLANFFRDRLSNLPKESYSHPSQYTGFAWHWTPLFPFTGCLIPSPDHEIIRRTSPSLPAN